MMKTIPSSFESRHYQESAWQAMNEFVNQRALGGVQPNGNELYCSMPIWMAAGAGKTFTVGSFLNSLYIARNQGMLSIKGPINTLILNDRIALINQLKTDLIDGRDNKAPILSTKITGHATIKVFHSRADTGPQSNEVSYIEEIGKGADKIYFSTFQTLTKVLAPHDIFDIIVIDEAHHLQADTYLEILKDLIKKCEQVRKRPPLVIPMTATMEPILHLVNVPLVKFSLPEYIASAYSPTIQYNLILAHDFTGSDTLSLNDQLQLIAQITDGRIKKKQLAAFRKKFEERLAKFVDLKHLVADLLSRLPALDHTIVFASKIEEANQIATEINVQTDTHTTAVALHSKIDEADEAILYAYHDGRIKVLVAVDKLNEGIDMPYTNHVVFWRNTNSPTIFQQQFGRGLRGDRVIFYDYVGTLRNLTWIQLLNSQIQQLGTDLSLEAGNHSVPHQRFDRKGIDILFANTVSSETSTAHEINIISIIDQISHITKTLSISSDDIRNFFLAKPYEERMSYSTHQIHGISYQGFKVKALAHRVGRKQINALRPSHFKKFISRLYGIEFRETKSVITKEEAVQFFLSKPMEERLTYTQKKIETIDFKGHKIVALAKVAGRTGKTPQSPSAFKRFVAELFSSTYQPLSPDEVKAFFKSQNFEKWMGMNQKQICAIEYCGHKITALAKILGWKGYRMTIPSIYRQFIAWLFEKELPIVKQQISLAEAHSFFKERSLHERLQYRRKEIVNIEFRGYKINALASLIGWKPKINSELAFKIFIAYVFGHSYTPVTRENIIHFFRSKKLEEWLEYSNKDIHAIEYNKLKVRSLARKVGWPNKYVQTPKYFKQFIQWVFNNDA